MQLQHIPLDQLDVSAFNMRHAKRPPDVADILPSVRARGILQPLLVRPNGEPDHYEIVAGRRRYFAARAVAEERGEIEPLPCAVMEPGDDAGALEASLIENVARLDADEMSQYETFVRLTREGKSVAEIAETFGITEIMVKRRLALGNLLPRIRAAYRKDEIDAETVRHLTLASKARQKDWLALFDDPEQYAPRGYQLKQWLFGGQSIPTGVALFPVEDYPGQIVADLFGEDAYFADTDLFWQKQNEAIAAKRDTLLAAGWGEVVVLEPGQGFRSWEHEKTPKKKGGKVYIAVSHRGEVEVHEGWLSRKEARRAARQAAGTAGEGEAPAVPRPEVTKAMQTYLDLHRHAAVRLALVAHPGAAFRLLVAHAVASSGHWQVKPEPQAAPTEAIAESIATSPAQQAFATERREALTLLGRSEDHHTVAQPGYDAYLTAAVFARLLTLCDEDVLRIAAFVMAETMEAGSAVVEAVGNHLNVDAGQHWQPDDAFFDLIRDKAVINAMLAEVADKAVADGNVAAKAKTQKKIIRDCLDGSNGRAKVEGWRPGWMAFPVRACTETGSLKTAEEWARVRCLFNAE
ncbi:ParB/RepB/Spo0J family partition protein [Shumkonia mesophila]|uniref:ParB/RepB/Spo0J family partition protein n=1 Tax=Shumkonia mesophila TaxID=2838854 RepID=UPI002934796C|nr:ParB/RepB/Spo0J family partition protein [Shumkonia mesophila]